MKILVNNQEVDIATLSLEEVHNWDFQNFLMRLFHQASLKMVNH